MAAELWTIRTEQITAFERLPFEEFEDRLVEHFFQFYPRECALLGAAQLREAIRYGVERAMRHDFSSEREVARYVNLMLMLGSDFDEDPQYPWLEEFFETPWQPGDPPRIRSVFDAAVQYLDDTVGEGNRNLLRAMLRIRSYDAAGEPQDEGEALEDALYRRLVAFYPQKAERTGREAMYRLIRLGVHDAAGHGIVDGAGTMIYVTLMYMLGSGFNHDPFYPWASRVLADPGLDAGQRAERLHRAALAHLEESLSGASASEVP